VDVIVARWQKLTGQQATRDGDGTTFDELQLRSRQKGGVHLVNGVRRDDRVGGPYQIESPLGAGGMGQEAGNFRPASCV
jgi:hypothetical protein